MARTGVPGEYEARLMDRIDKCLLMAIVLLMVGSLAVVAMAAEPVPPSDIGCGENCVEYEQGIRVIETGTDIRNCWSQQDACTGCEVTEYWNFEVLEFPAGQEASLAINEIEKGGDGDVTHCQVWRPTKAGLYSIRVNSCSDEGCSRWSDSWNPEHSQHPRGFVYYIKVQAPTGGGIE